VQRAQFFRRACFGLIAALALLIALEVGFVDEMKVGDAGTNVRVVKGWPPSQTWEGCLAETGSVNPDLCWRFRPVFEAAIAFSYLAILGSLGALFGLVPRSPSRSPEGYLDFDLRIEPLEGGRYRAAVSTSEQFQASVEFSLPLALCDLRVPLCFARQGATRGGAAEAMQDPEEVGRSLFEAVFRDDVLAGFRIGVLNAEGGQGVRLRLHLDRVPQLAGLPWEYLYDARLAGYLATSARTSVVRYLDLPEPVRPQAVDLPLRVLVMISTPGDYGELAQAGAEWARLCAALEPLVRRQLVSIERVSPTVEALQKRLRTGEPAHVLHFVGHGGFNETWQQGVLILEGENHKGRPVASQGFADLLRDHRSLRLVVLNACNGARSSGDDALAGTAQSLVERAGIPAVVAMRTEVSDETACQFAETFYQTLADLWPVDACMGEARKALAVDNNPEWGTPVLYLRAADGRIFARADEVAAA
jgi:hypothetical protein